MDEQLIPPVDQESEQEVFPLEPRYHPIHKIPRKIYEFLASARLAMVLLVTILICCVSGATIWRGAEAGRMVFGTLWFNSILVLLVVNIACCFFGRIWGRRVTLISFGMILFHLCFVSILLAIVFNSLFFFRGNIRLTEGEVLPSSDPRSYDWFEQGRFFKFSRLKGDTTLIRMHAGYKVGKEDKRAAYEVGVGEGADSVKDLIYITHKLSHHGVDYFNDREGYSLLLLLSDKQGHEIYGGHIPLQSIRQKDGSFKYSTGYKDGDSVKPDVIIYPGPPEKPLMALQVGYVVSKLKERAGDALFSAFPLDKDGKPVFAKAPAEAKVPIGGLFAAGEYNITAKEVRYWVGMTVRYEPGKPIVLASLWIGLAGMLITTIGRMLRGRRKGL
jgi:hypothetical protein